MLCAGPHNRAVQPSTGRTSASRATSSLAEITPSYRGQLAQICRTVVIGGRSDRARAQIRAGGACDGRRASPPRVPGVAMAEVCRAINAVLEAQGYGEFCHPPHIRRRGHGLGFALDAARRRRARQRHRARARHAVHDPSQPVPAGDRLSAVRRAGGDDRQGRRASPARRRRWRRSGASRNCIILC